MEIYVLDEHQCEWVSNQICADKNEVNNLLLCKNLTIRQLLQIIGTDLIRVYNPQWHIQNLRTKMNNIKENSSNVNNIKFCIPDLRFLNEKQFIENLNGTCYVIIRPYATNVTISNHVSETQLNWSYFGNNIIINDGDKTQLLNMVKKLDQIKIFTSESVAKGKEMKAVAESYIKSNKLEELMRANNGGKNVKIYVKNGASDAIIKELFMYIEGDARDKNTVVLSLVGNMDLDEISELTEILNLPGSAEIKKASEKK
jgi:hypothetical protein